MLLTERHQGRPQAQGDRAVHIYAGARSLEYIEQVVERDDFQRLFKIWNDEVSQPTTLMDVQVADKTLTPSTNAQEARELCIDMLQSAVTAAGNRLARICLKIRPLGLRSKAHPRTTSSSCSRRTPTSGI